MKQLNNKILSVVLVAGIATTGFAALSSANNSGTGSAFRGKGVMSQIEQKVQNGETLTADEQTQYDEMQAHKAEMDAIKPILEKKKAGETLSADEQAQLDAFEANRPAGPDGGFGPNGGKGGKMGFDGFGKRAGFANLTDEEKTALESMTDIEKKAFFDQKKTEMEAQRTAEKAVIDKLIAGETLTADEEATRLELVNKFADENNKQTERRDGGDIIAKLVAGDTLTADEQAQLAQMQELNAQREAEKAKIDAMTDTEKQAYFTEKKAEMDAQMQAIKPILEKKKAGETLSADEQAQLDTFEANKPMGGFDGPMGRGRGHGPHNGDHDMEAQDDNGATDTSTQQQN